MIPYELLEKIALVDIKAFNKMVRAIPKLGRKTLQRSFQNFIIGHFGTTVVGENGIRMYLGGNLHSIYDRPALKCRTSICWYYSGDLHRTPDILGKDRPALVYNDGTEHYYHYGNMHRDGDKPAMIHSDGSKHWYKNGYLHRDRYRPAIVNISGTKRYYKHGIIYRQYIDNIIHKVYICIFAMGIILYVVFKN